MRKFVSCSMGAVIGVAATFSAVNSSIAGVFPVDTAAMNTAAPQDVVEVRYRGGALFAGLALGLMGAAIAGSYYYGPSYYYPPYYPGNAYPPYPYYGPYYWGYPTYAYPVYPRYRYYGFRTSLVTVRGSCGKKSTSWRSTSLKSSPASNCPYEHGC